MPRAADLPTTRFALRGRLVTLDDRNTVLDDGVLYIDAGRITAVLGADAPPDRTWAAPPPRSLWPR
ncbi:hypothetical protein [Streptomyces sp. NPDC001286]